MWPFDQPENCATITTSHVMRHGATITRAYHDEIDHGWQFYSEHVTQTKDAMIVALREIVAIDPTITEIADLLPGWMAKREAVGSFWQRDLQYADAAIVLVDWSYVLCESDFYVIVLPQCGSPGWHGRNLDALADSWITGGIDQMGPPYAFGFFNIESTPPDMLGFRDAILEIAQDSIDENGGRFIPQTQPADTDPAAARADEAAFQRAMSKIPATPVTEEWDMMPDGTCGEP